jgi:hypothetical protein
MSNTLWPAPVHSVLGCKIPHELDALKWKAMGRRRRRRYLKGSRWKERDVRGRFYILEA